MKNSSKTKLILAIFIAVAAIAIMATPEVSVHAQQLFPQEPTGEQADFRIYIQAFYAFAIPMSILIATVLIMIGGVIWITSAGNQTRVAKAKDFIINSIIGVILLLGAYVILAVVNPNLVTLKFPEFKDLGKWETCADGSVVQLGEECPVVTDREQSGLRDCDTYTIPYSSNLGCNEAMDGCSVFCSNKICDVGSLALEANGTKYTCDCADKGKGIGLSTTCQVTGGACVKFPAKPDEYSNTCNQVQTEKECRDQVSKELHYWDYKFLNNQRCSQINYASMTASTLSIPSAAN